MDGIHISGIFPLSYPLNVKEDKAEYPTSTDMGPRSEMDQNLKKEEARFRLSPKNPITKYE